MLYINLLLAYYYGYVKQKNLLFRWYFVVALYLIYISLFRNTSLFNSSHLVKAYLFRNI